MSQTSSSSLVSVNSPSTLPYIKCNFLELGSGNERALPLMRDLFGNDQYFVDLNEKPVWNDEIGLLLSYWLQQRANHDDIFGR